MIVNMLHLNHLQKEKTDEEHFYEQFSFSSSFVQLGKN